MDERRPQARGLDRAAHGQDPSLVRRGCRAASSRAARQAGSCPRPRGSPGRRGVACHAFWNTSRSKSQRPAPGARIDSFTMCATAAAWCPRRPSSHRGLARPHGVEEAGHVQDGRVGADLLPGLALALHRGGPGVGPLALLHLGVRPVGVLERRGPGGHDPVVALDRVLRREDHPAAPEHQRALVAQDHEAALAAAALLKVPRARR